MLPKHYSLFEAQFPDDVTCLGVALLPLSIGHLMLLNRVASPFVTNEEEPSMDDLALAVFICGQDHNEAWQLIKSGKHEQILKAWAEDLTTEKKGLFRKKLKPINFYRELEVFREYFARSCSWPDFMAKKEGKDQGVPLLQKVKLFLLSETTLTEKEILSRPYALCMWDFISGIAQKTDVEIVDEDNYQEMKRQTNEAVKKLKEKGVIPA